VAETATSASAPHEMERIGPDVLFSQPWHGCRIPRDGMQIGFMRQPNLSENWGE
jgi:hypothetical protein